MEKHGKRILSITEVLDQERVMISLESLFWYHNPSTGYRYLENAVEDILSNRDHTTRLIEHDINIVRKEGKYYIVIPRNKILQLMRKESEQQCH